MVVVRPFAPRSIVVMEVLRLEARSLLSRLE